MLRWTQTVSDQTKVQIQLEESQRRRVCVCVYNKLDK